jgi:3-keto-L-gulonate-6-phosphate decarboxylase
MGSKNLKAVVVRGHHHVVVADEEGYKKMISKIRKIVETHPITGVDGSLARFGTSLLVHRITAAGMLPADNFSDKKLSFEKVDQFSGETVKEKYLVRRTACFACPTACGRWVKIGDWEGKGPEFESVAMIGPNSGFFDYENEIVPICKLCDDLGMDTISMGVILGFVKANGWIHDINEALSFVREVASGKSVFSHGIAVASKTIGKGVLAPHSRGLELPAYDPRGAKGMALAYATSNRGGCHLQAYTIAPEILSNPEFVDPATEVGKAELVKKMQDAYAVYDSLVACKFHSFSLFATLDFELDDLAKLLTAVTGLEWTGKQLQEAGSRIYTIERMFNSREKLGPEQDKLPKQFGIDLTRMLREYYKLRGWGPRGVPRKIPPIRKPKSAGKVEVTLSPVERLQFPQLQVALDMDADLKTVAKVAAEAYAGGARIIEAGTPAVKRHGVDQLIRVLRKAAPEAVIVADLKTMDVGNLEARIAFRAGADVMAVLGIGGRTKIIEAVSEAARWDKAVLVDLIDCADPLEMIDSLTKDLKGHESRVIFCLHRGISEQLKGRGIYEQKQLISEAKVRAGGFKLAVAGGIKEGVAKGVAAAGADICIAGSSIYNSASPRDAARRILAEVKS